MEAIGLAIILATAIGFWFVKRHTWLLAAPLGFAVSFSLFFALTEGWDAQVQTALTIAKAAITIGAIVLFIAVIAVTTRAFIRMNRHMREVAHNAGAQIADEGLFRDDGERIIVHASRGRLLLRVLLGIAVLALFAGGYLWAYATVLNQFWQITLGLCVGILLCFGGVATLLMLMRMMMAGPTLVVNADGILDNCSMIITGRGLLRWNETLDVEEYIVSTNKAITYHYLDINVTDARAINRRQPLWKRMLAVFASERQPMGFRIPRPLLDRPVGELVEEITRYIHTHAPEGSWHKAMADEETEQPPED